MQNASAQLICYYSSGKDVTALCVLASFNFIIKIDSDFWRCVGSASGSCHGPRTVDAIPCQAKITELDSQTGDRYCLIVVLFLVNPNENVAGLDIP